MVWHRLPSFLPNFVLRLLPLSEKQLKTYAATGFVRDVSFRTAPQTTKPEIKQYLERVYNLNVATVRTLNVEGKKKRGKHGFYRRPDFKKVYVTLNPGPAAASATR